MRMDEESRELKPTVNVINVGNNALNKSRPLFI